jgi:hypothetical protein
MFDLGQIAIDPAKLQGVWWQVHREPDGTIGGRAVPEPTEEGCLRIVPMGREYDEALEKAREPYLAAIRAGRVTDEEGRKILGDALAAAVLVDWRNLKARGEPVSYSREKAAEMLADNQWLLLREFIIRAAQHRGALLAENEEAAKGN